MLRPGGAIEVALSSGVGRIGIPAGRSPCIGHVV
jgi:hypothetical protein